MNSHFPRLLLVKFLFTFFFASGFYSFVSAQTPLSSGTEIPIRITEMVTSETDTSALIVKEAHAVVDRDVTSTDGKVLIKANTPVAITATLQRTRGRGRAGSLLLTPISTTSADGQTISLTGNFRKEGKSFKGLTYLVAGGAFVALVVVGALLINAGSQEDFLDEDDGGGKRLAGGIILGLAPFQWLWLLRHGQAVEVKPGSVLVGIRPERDYTVQ